MSANAARDVAAQLRLLRQRAATDAPLAACRALGQAAETAVKVTLTSSTHPPGTTTPSDPGQPPSLVTGRLRRSVTRTPPRLIAPGSAACLVGSAVIYAAVHEFGPVTIHARNFPQLGNPKVGFFGRQVTIPRRPWLEPATRRLESSGIGQRVVDAAWMDAMGI
jgi:phage gpG-like protein